MLQVLCGVVGIPYNNLAKYVCENKLFNQEVGRGVGRNSLISEKNQKFTTGVMARNDRDNEEMTTAEGVDIILEVIPQISCKQAQQ